ncbi:MAG: atpD, partial [Candidatus Dadabacteria bacterium]|nr:atpD [Candidatus Dadabacteria bacterium]
MTSAVESDNKTSIKIGEVVSVKGPVVDVRFPPGELPKIYNALEINEKTESGIPVKLT